MRTYTEFDRDYGEPVVTTPVRAGTSRRGDAVYVREGEVERLSRSLAKEMDATDPRGIFVVSKEIVSTVATKSGSLKGTYVQALNRVATAVNRVATAVETRLDDLLKRTSTDEVISLRLQMEELQALYTFVQVENAELRAESARVREEMARMRVVLDDVVGCQGRIRCT